MPDYFKNLSTYRVILFCVLLVTAGISLVSVIMRDRGGNDSGNNMINRRIQKGFQECVQNFGSYIASLEAVGLDLARQYEQFEEPRDTDTTGQLLRSFLDTTPSYVLGVGIIHRGMGQEPRQIAYLPKTEHQIASEVSAAFHNGLEYGQAASAREINTNRRMSWLLMSAPVGENRPRFSTIFKVSLGGLDVNMGEVAITANLSWIENLFRRLETSGAYPVVCVTPQHDILWLENDRLVFHKDYSRRDIDVEYPFVGRILRRLKVGNPNADNDEFLSADILGTRWWLFASDGAGPRPIERRFPVSVVAFIVSLLFVLLDMLVFSLLPSVAANNEPAKESLLSERKKNVSGNRIFASLYNLLFRYRMVNPEQARIESEMQVARRIQFTLVPGTFPEYSEWREFDLYSILSPAKEVGGDYYDFFMLDSNRLILTAGDVSGKGVPAALYMAVCRTAFRTVAREANSPGEILTRLNDLLVRDSKSGYYITMVTFIVDLPTGTCEYAIAGHPAPLWYEEESKTAVLVDRPRETFIGMKAGLSFPIGSLRFSPGDTLLLYTDGVTEARNNENEELEYEGLSKIFMEKVGADCCQTLIEDMEHSIHGFMGTHEQQDDLTLLAFRYWGQGGQRMLKRRTQRKAGGKSDAT